MNAKIKIFLFLWLLVSSFQFQALTYAQKETIKKWRRNKEVTFILYQNFRSKTYIHATTGKPKFTRTKVTYTSLTHSTVVVSGVYRAEKIIH